MPNKQSKYPKISFAGTLSMFVVEAIARANLIHPIARSLGSRIPDERSNSSVSSGVITKGTSEIACRKTDCHFEDEEDEGPVYSFVDETTTFDAVITNHHVDRGSMKAIYKVCTPPLLSLTPTGLSQTPRCPFKGKVANGT